MRYTLQDKYSLQMRYRLVQIATLVSFLSKVPFVSLNVLQSSAKKDSEEHFICHF